MSADDGKKGRGNRRPSGVGSNSRRFASVDMPDGRKAMIPAAKDAATYICLVTAKGEWPKKSLIVLLYDAVWLVDGSVFEVEEMRPGRGMGNLMTLRVIAVHARAQVHDGNYGQMQRWLLCDQVSSGDDTDELSADELRGVN